MPINHINKITNILFFKIHYRETAKSWLDMKHIKAENKKDYIFYYITYLVGVE